MDDGGESGGAIATASAAGASSLSGVGPVKRSIGGLGGMSLAGLAALAIWTTSKWLLISVAASYRVRS
jgi:hypothetical protein